jgi:hypothetical protein
MHPLDTCTDDRWSIFPVGMELRAEENTLGSEIIYTKKYR